MKNSGPDRLPNVAVRRRGVNVCVSYSRFFDSEDPACMYYGMRCSVCICMAMHRCLTCGCVGSIQKKSVQATKKRFFSFKVHVACVFKVHGVVFFACTACFYLSARPGFFLSARWRRLHGRGYLNESSGPGGPTLSFKYPVPHT